MIGMNLGLLAPTAPIVAGNAKEAGRADELRKYAREFEASLIKDWWKSSQASLKLDSPEESSSDSESMRDMGAEALAAGVVAHGGIGIANMLVHSLLGAVLVK